MEGHSFFFRFYAVYRIIYMNLCVLWVILVWLAGTDSYLAFRLRRMNREHARLTAGLNHLAAADPRREDIIADISLLEEDTARFCAIREESFRKALEPLQTRFADELSTCR